MSPPITFKELISLENILQMQGIQPELRRAMGTVGSLAIPFATPVNAVAAKATLAAADIAIIDAGDKVVFDGVEYVKGVGAEEWADATALAALLDDVPGWGAATDAGAVVVTSEIRGAAYNGEVVAAVKLEATTAGGDGAGGKATATIAAATIAQRANGDTVSFDGAVFTKAAATKVADGTFADQAGLIACIDDLADWVAVDNAGAIAITAATDAVDFNGKDIAVTLRRVTAAGVDGTPAYAGAVCADAGFIYVCTDTDTTLGNNNWERVAIAAF